MKYVNPPRSRLGQMPIANIVEHYRGDLEVALHEALVGTWFELDSLPAHDPTTVQARARKLRQAFGDDFDFRRQGHKLIARRRH